MKFFWDEHYTNNVPRGPLGNSTDRLTSSLSIERIDCERKLQQSADGDEIEEAERSLSIIKRLLKAMDIIFRKEDLKEPTALFHNNLSAQNVLVDEDGALTGIVHWECTTVVPLWKAAQLPALLTNRQREAEPVRDLYADDIEENGTESLYYIHLREYEITQLHNVFLEEMKRLSPEWTDIFHSSDGRLRADFELALEECDPESIGRRAVERWLDGFEKDGKPGPSTRTLLSWVIILSRSAFI